MKNLQTLKKVRFGEKALTVPKKDAATHDMMMPIFRPNLSDKNPNPATPTRKPAKYTEVERLAKIDLSQDRFH